MQNSTKNNFNNNQFKYTKLPLSISLGVQYNIGKIDFRNGVISQNEFNHIQSQYELHLSTN